MGVDLTLGFNVSVTEDALTRPYFDLGFLATNRLSFGGRYHDPWESFRAIAAPFPGPVDWYGDEGIESLRTDPHGEPLTYMRAGQFAEVDTSVITYAWDRAILDFLARIPPETIVILRWH